MVVGKHKGSSFEAKIDRMLKAEGITSRRTPGSGATFDDKGDVITCNYIIECKHMKAISVGFLNKVWEKLVEQAKLMQKTPIIVYRENGKPIMVFRKGEDEHCEWYLFEEFIEWIKRWE